MTGTSIRREPIIWKVIFYEELKRRVLKHLRLTANEYKRFFRMAQKPRGVSCSKFASHLEPMFGYYVASHNMLSLAALMQLMIAERLKQVKCAEIRTYVLQNVYVGWLRSRELAELSENFKGSFSDRRPEGRERNEEEPLE